MHISLLIVKKLGEFINIKQMFINNVLETPEK